MTLYDRQLNPNINCIAQDVQIPKNLPTRIRIDTLTFC